MNFAGFIAWWLWRTIYLMKLPRFERNVRVAFDWTLDLLFTKDLVQCPTARAVPAVLREDVHAASELRAAS
jgi:NADH:ubiquinone reductase (H+-translocating)